MCLLKYKNFCYSFIAADDFDTLAAVAVVATPHTAIVEIPEKKPSEDEDEPLCLPGKVDAYLVWNLSPIEPVCFKFMYDYNNHSPS